MLVRVVLLLLLWMAGLLLAPVQGAPLAEIQKRGTLNVCAHPDALPFSSQSRTEPGFQIEIAEEIARKLGVQLDVRWIIFRYHARRANCDATIGSIVMLDKKEEGRRRVRQTRPYAGSRYVLVVSPNKSGVQSLEDLKGAKVGVEHASWPHYLMDKRGIPVASYRTAMEILDAVARGEVEAGLVSDPYAGWYLKQHPNAVKVVEGYTPDPSLRWNVAVGLRKADDALVEAVNQVLDEMLSSQKIQKIFAKYGVTYIPPFSQ
ncbi:MAG: hypothetical protein D6736_07870 [Nitrospinota bacterium]|nr:MAG: hypothetical protein D6736_07870 [Nitrospinota bacterium]